MDLAKLKRQRTGLRRQMTKQCNSMEELMEKAIDAPDLAIVSANIKLMTDYNAKLQTFDDQILMKLFEEQAANLDIEDEGDDQENEVDLEMSMAAKYQIQINSVLYNLLMAMKAAPESSNSSVSSVAVARPSTGKQDKLPKVHLKELVKEEFKREMKKEQAREGFRWESSEYQAPVDKPASSTKQKSKKKFDEENVAKVAGLLAQGGSDRQPCVFCGKNNHQSRSCFKVRNMALELKEKLVRENRCCFRCLASGHRASVCKSNIVCQKCGRNHSDIMCKGLGSTGANIGGNAGGGDKSELVPPKQKEEKENVTASNMGIQCQDDVLLKTVIVKVQNPSSGKEADIRILFDDASHGSYVTNRVVNFKIEHDLRVKQEFQLNLRRDETGQYIVKLPWISSEIAIPSNYEVALRRLENMKRFKTHEDFIVYDEIFKSWRKEKIIEVLPTEEEKDGHFLPHHPVIKFRRKQIGAVADIHKAFQTISVDPEDQNYQRFLWWKYRDKSVMEYRHCRVVFGMTCSPFILPAVLDHHLSNEGGDAAEMLKRSLYVDNCVTSFDNEEEYLQFKEDSIGLLLKAQMILRQWESNVDQTMEQRETSVLGLTWDKREDTLFIKMPKGINTMDLEYVTSRKALAIVAQIYDPIGFVCPSLLQPKMLLQRGWLHKKKWDEPWEEEDTKLFLKWLSAKEILCKIRIPRFAFGSVIGEGNKMELHIFCDASQNAYASVAFIRIEDDCGVTVQLLMAKSRVAPLENRGSSKKITVPRLELLACVSGARIGSTIKEAIKLVDLPITFWSDSSTCIAWIQRDEDWGTFVGNRVREIVKLSKHENWRHIPGCSNPADLPSRGCSSQQLYESSWWEGPAWLKLQPDDWPVSTPMNNEEEILVEKKKTTASCYTEEEVNMKFSRYKVNVRIAAWVRRFITNCRLKTFPRRKLLDLDKISDIPPLSLEEIECGERDLLRCVQKRRFGDQLTLKGLPVEFPEGVEFGIKFYKSGYQKIQELRTALHSRFRKDYLGFITSRNLKEHNRSANIGDLVLVGDTNRKRFELPLGRILETFPGKDGKVRVVRVKTSHGILTRPVQRLYPLESIEVTKTRESDEQEESGTGAQSVMTRSGRVIKSPLRYGQWNH